MPSNEQTQEAKTTPQDPIELLAQAGYDAFIADTLDKQNSISGHYKKGELLCTFNDAIRHKIYHIIHAVRRDAGQLTRNDFNGIEKRQDEYGTSVISIQILKNGGFISIKNRYNHTVPGCDNTFDSNPDNIIDGLSDALKSYFGVDFTVTKSTLGEGFVLMGNRIFKYDREINNIYYGDGAWAKVGAIHTANKGAGDALFDGFLFCNKSKALVKIDPQSKDSFADDFNRDYGGDKRLIVRDGNLYLGDHCLIGAKQSRIITLDLPDLETMSNYSLKKTEMLVSFKADKLKTMGKQCLMKAGQLEFFQAASLQTMKHECLLHTSSLAEFFAPRITSMGYGCLMATEALEIFNTPSLINMGGKCLLRRSGGKPLSKFNAPHLSKRPEYLDKLIPTKHRNIPALTNRSFP